MSTLKRKYESFLPRFLTALPMDDVMFLAQLIAGEMFHGDTKGKVNVKSSTTAEKATKFLNLCIEPAFSVDGNSNDALFKLLTIMEASDFAPASELAKEFKSELSRCCNILHDTIKCELKVASSPRTALKEMSTDEQLRIEINNLKADMTQLRQQVYSQNNEYATLKYENESLKVINDILKVENIRLKQQLIQKESISSDDLYSGLMNIKWKEGSPAPVGRVDHTAAWLNGLVYVGGGYESGYTNSYKIDCYDPVKDSWSSPINTPFRHFAIVTLNNKLLAVGGVDINYKTTSHILIMDDDDLKNYTKMITARSWAAAVSYQEMLIIAGGMCGENMLASTECFDSKTKQWYVCDPLPQPSYCLQSVIVDDILYLSGGATERGDSPAVFTSPLDKLSKRQLKWKIYEDIPCSAPALVSIGGTYLLIVGGIRWKEIPMRTSTLDVHRLNKVDHSWEAIGQIPSPRKSPAAVCTADNRIIVIAGWNDKGEYTNTVWIGSCAPQ